MIFFAFLIWNFFTVAYILESIADTICSRSALTPALDVGTEKAFFFSQKQILKNQSYRNIYFTSSIISVSVWKIVQIWVT